MFVLYALLILIPLIIFYIHRKHVNEDGKVGVSGPKGLPLIGSILEVYPYAKSQTLFKKFFEYHETYGDTFQVRMGPTKMIISRDPKVTEALANNPQLSKSAEYKLLKPWLGDGLVISNGEKWHKMRKLMTPAFHFQILERFIPIFEEQVDIFLNILDKEKDNPKGIDIFPKMHALTLDIITETSMGAQLKAQSDFHHPYIVANEKVACVMDQRFFNGFLAIEWIWKLTPYYKIHNENVAIINDYVEKVIKERHEKLLKENNNQAKNDEEESEIKKRPALLDILLQAKVNGEPLSNEDIRAEVKIFMFAGHETTANSLAFAIYLIAKHPEVQQKMYSEIKSNLLDNKSEPLSSRNLNSLSYIDNVCKEALRLYPAAPMIMKKSHEDLKIGNLVIPKDTTIGTNIYSGHRMEKYFKNAKTFDPDRFNKEITAEDRNPYVFQPFSSGLRNCIGQKFAMLEMKTILVKLISTFEIELMDKNFEVDLIQMGTLRSRNGVPLKMISRNPLKKIT